MSAFFPWVRRLLLAGALVLVGDSIRRVILRMQFDYDLLLWADDYFMTSMFKLAAGVPVYTKVAEGNSTIYAPGGPYLHYALLAPFGLDTNLLAHRVLNQCWLWTDVLLGLLVVRSLSGQRLPRGGVMERAVVWGIGAAVVALAAYANPVVDSLHPNNLELAALLGTQLALVRWQSLTARWRWILVVALPIVALLAKQTAGLAVTGAFVWWLWRSGGTLSERSRALVPILALAVVLVVLQVTNDGHFKVWAFDVLAAQHFDWWKVRDIYAGYFLLFAPAGSTSLVYAVVAWQRRAAHHLAWSRAAVVVLLYTPFSLTALFKAMGGPNNLAVVGFLLVVLALPVWFGVWSGASSSRREMGVAILMAAQVALFYPRRRVPDRLDFDNAATVCGYAAARMRCGERVMLGRGSVCYARGGVGVPTDRMNSIIEVAVAGRREELGFYQRTIDKEYDLIILPARDLHWGGQHLWNIMRFRYRPFFMTRGKLEGDFWYHGWQGFTTLPVVFWERIDEAGTHAVTAEGRRCDPVEPSRRGSQRRFPPASD